MWSLKRGARTVKRKIWAVTREVRSVMWKQISAMRKIWFSREEIVLGDRIP